MDTADEDEIRAWAEEYAKKNGWVLNPDKKVLSAVIRGLAHNKKKIGELYCPSGSGTGTKRRIGRSSVPVSAIRMRSRRTGTATASSISGKMPQKR